MQFKVVVCRGPECGDRRGSRAIYAELVRHLGAAGLTDRVELSWQSCFGRCTRGPNVLVRSVPRDAPPRPRFRLATMPAPRGARSVLYNRVTPGDVIDIVREHLVAGRPVRRLVERPPGASSSSSSSEPAVLLRVTTGTEGDS